MAKALTLPKRERASYAIGPLTTYAEPAAMAAWLADAEAPPEMVYASGPMLGRDAPAAAVARGWAAQGLVSAVQRARPGGGKDYLLQKRARAPAARPGPGEAGDGDPRAEPLGGPGDWAWEESEDGRVWRYLARLANLGLACPTNEAIAEACDLPDGRAARHRLKRLKAAGQIAIEAPAGIGPRVVRIAASGRCTASGFPGGGT